MPKNYIISIDLGGTKILSALIDVNNKIKSKEKIPTELINGKEGLVNSIVQSIKKVMKENEVTEREIKAISLGVPGTVNPYTGIISNAPNLGIKNFNIKEALLKHFSIPLLIENDVNLAGLGIKKFETGEETNNMLVVFVGTGIGGALFFDGKIYRGSTFFAGEIGHMKVNSRGSLLSKDKNSTFELLASRTAIVRDIKKELKKGKKSILKEYSSPTKLLKSKGLALAVKKSDPLAVKYVSKSAVTIGTVLGNLVTLLNLDTIVLGGGVFEAMGDFMMPKVRKAFIKSVLPEPGKTVKIVQTKLGDDAAIYGGIALAEEFLNK
ncbi:MAG: ROK family protein [Melioribacteraceae bacterium]|nr:ROK family protein [Melioribacteraceae bacterium]